MNVIEAAATIQCLEAEIRRLEHALTSAELLTALLQPPPPPPLVVPPLDLTPRETEVLMRLIEGDSNPEIANHLFMALGTVKSHLRGLSRKFETHTRTGTVVAAIRAGFVPDQQEA